MPSSFEWILQRQRSWHLLKPGSVDTYVNLSYLKQKTVCISRPQKVVDTISLRFESRETQSLSV